MEEPTEAQLFELPDFEGMKPVAVETKLNGAGQRIVRPLGLEQRIVLVVEAEVEDVNHKTTKQGVKRIHTLKVKDLYEAEGKEGKKLLSNMRLRQKKSNDERAGRPALPGVDEQVHTDHGLTLDENGVALTEEEVAEARGQETPDLIDDGPIPVILIFSDKSRSLWPDDYVNTDYQSDPYAGDFMPNPNRENKTEDLRVIEVQDVETGESLGIWGEKEREAELIEEEKKAKAEEAKAEKPKKKSTKKKAPKVIVDEITPAEEADAIAPPLPDEVDE